MVQGLVASVYPCETDKTCVLVFHVDISKCTKSLLKSERAKPNLYFTQYLILSITFSKGNTSLNEVRVGGYSQKIESHRYNIIQSEYTNDDT